MQFKLMRPLHGPKRLREQLEESRQTQGCPSRYQIPVTNCQLPVASYQKPDTKNKMKLIRHAKCQARIDVAPFLCYVSLFVFWPYDFSIAPSFPGLPPFWLEQKLA